MPEEKKVQQLIDQGLAHLQQKDYQKAEKAFTKALQLDPVHLVALRNCILVRQNLGQPQEAEALLRDALTHHPDDPWLRLQQGRLYYDNRRNQEASAIFAALLETDPENEYLLQLQLSTLRRLHRYDQVDALLRTAKQHHPKSPGILLEEAWLYYDRGDYETALQAFQRALEVDPKNLNALIWSVTSLRMLDRYDEALEVLTTAHRLYPDNIRLLMERAWWHYDQGEYGAAVGYLDRILAQDGAHENALRWKLASLRRQGLFEDAEQFAAQALAARPDSAPLLLELGWVYDNQSKYAEAVEVYNRILALPNEARNESALEMKIQALRKNKEFDAALEEIEAALRVHPKSAKILNQKAWCFYDQNSYDRAIEIFSEVLSAHPGNTDALRWRIVSYRMLRRFAHAEKLMQEALVQRPKDIDLLKERGWLFYDQKKYEKAIASFDQILALSPGNQEASRWKAAALRLLRRFEEAEGLLQMGLEKAPEDPDLLKEFGWMRFDQRQYTGALDFFNRILKKDESNTEAIRWKAASLRMLRRFPEAEETIDAALAHDPDSAELLNEKGWIHFKCDQFDDAERCFARAIGKAPHSAYLYYDRIEALHRLNRGHEALQLFQQLKLNYPDDLEVWDQLGWFHIRRNDAFSARREFEHILQRDPEHISGINGMGAVAFNEGRYEEAAGHFRRVLEAEPSNPIWHTNLAWALTRQGSKEVFADAEAHCMHSLELDPDYAPTYGCLGVLAFKKGRIPESEDYLKKTILINPQEGSYTDLGALYVHTGRYEEAEKNLQEAIRINRHDAQAHTELGHLYLQTDRIRDAVHKFRAAISLNAYNEEPHRALAIAHMMLDDLDEGEKILRSAIRGLHKVQTWRLYLTLAQLLARRGHETEEAEYFEEALEQLNAAMKIKSNQPELTFQRGIVKYKQGNLRGALKDFKSCPPDHYKAARYARQIKSKLRKSLVRSDYLGGVVVGGISFSQLLYIWHLYLSQQVSETTLTIIVPILLGLVVVAFLLPTLARLKLPGLEAELRAPAETASKGPTGEGGFKSAMPTITTGPS